MTTARSAPHIPRSCEFLILGSGFGGSLLATILARAGRSIVLIDKAEHPRFAIGESSTPLADQTLRRIAEKFQIPEVLPLCAWGTWKRTYPNVMCGRKRGFTYFDLTDGQDLTNESFERRRLLVAASATDEESDTHWLRSDVDHFLFRLAERSGVVCLENCRTELTAEATESRWRIAGSCPQGVFNLSSEFVIDATGFTGALLRTLNIADRTAELRTNARSLYAHFTGTHSCERLLQDAGVDLDAMPFHCDDAAVHQVLSDGWMWQLRFDDQSLSAGFMIDQRPGTATAITMSASEDWQRRIALSPFLSRQFAAAKLIRPSTGLQQTGRLQRLAATAAGSHWAALTNTVGFIDPLHSSGIAHTLSAIERLVGILLSGCSLPERTGRLAAWSGELIEELRCIDELIEGCYAALPSFELWCDWSMLYFAAATSMEHRSASSTSSPGFLCAADKDFRAVVSEARHRLARVLDAGSGLQRAERVDQFRLWLRQSLAPWNHVGLFDETARNLYQSTVAPSRR